MQLFLALVCLVSFLALAHGQLIDDFSAPFAVEGENNLGYWRGGEGVTAAIPRGVAIAGGAAYWAEVIASAATCNDLTGKSLKVAYTASEAGQRVIELHLKADNCQGARASVATTRINVAAGAGEVTVPVTAFSGGNPRLGYAVAFKGPITIRRIELVGSGSPDRRCVLPRADVGGCSADKVCPFGLCCSEHGWCGNTAAYCNDKCQSQCDLSPLPGLPTCGSAPGPDPVRSIPDPASHADKWVPSDRLKNGNFDKDEFGSYNTCGWAGMLALTYDDGPSPVNTPPILDALRDANVKATFFWLGTLVRDHVALASRARDEGHHIASHSWSHPDLTKLSEADLANEVIWTEREIRNVVGLRPRFFRPPYISINQRVYNYLTSRSYKVIIWSIDSGDWAGASQEEIVRNFREQAVSPSSRSHIAIQHDINANTAATAQAVIRQVLTNGFKPVPMYLCLNEYAYQQ